MYIYICIYVCMYASSEWTSVTRLENRLLARSASPCFLPGFLLVEPFMLS